MPWICSTLWRAREAARGRDFLEQRLDVGAEELERLVAGLADQMEVPRVPVRVLEPEAPFAEVDLARDAGVHHPLQRAVDGGAADAADVLAADQVDEIVGAEVPLLAQEDVDDEVALARAFAARGPKAVEIRKLGRRSANRRQPVPDGPRR